MENKKQNKNNYQLYNFPLYIDLDEATENQYFIVDYAHLITGDLFKLSHVEIKPNVIHYWFIIDDFDDAENDPILETLDDYNIILNEALKNSKYTEFFALSQFNFSSPEDIIDFGNFYLLYISMYIYKDKVIDEFFEKYGLKPTYDGFIRFIKEIENFK